jgi:hypothetical protein
MTDGCLSLTLSQESRVADRHPLGDHLDVAAIAQVEGICHSRSSPNKLRTLSASSQNSNGVNFLASLSSHGSPQNPVTHVRLHRYNNNIPFRSLEK